MTSKEKAQAIFGGMLGKLGLEPPPSPLGQLRADRRRARPGWMKAHRAKVIALRPDRFVAAADSSGLRVPA